MKSKKIIIIGPAYPLRGGLASFNERMARAFIAHGDDVSIYTFSLQYPGFLFPGTTQYSSGPAPADLNIFPAINSVNPFNWISVGTKLKKEKADIIIVRYWLPFMGPCLGTILRIVKKNRHTKVICIADNIIPHEKRPGDMAFTKYFIKPVDGFITMSDRVLEDLKKLTNKPAITVRHPLYDNFGHAIPKAEARKHLDLPADTPLMLFFGFIRKYKGLDILLEALAILKKRKPPVLPKLLIAGEFYEDEKPYLEMIRTLDLEDMVILRTSFIADEEVKHYLCAADVVLQPYRDATQSGVTPLAYHFEIPMIVTNVGGLPALVPHNVSGMVSEPNATAIADSITSFFEKGSNHFLPGLKSEKQKYSWNNMVDAVFSF